MTDTNTKIKTDIQDLNPGSELISLYILDASSLGGAIYYFIPGTKDSLPVHFNGITYIPLPVEFSDMEVTGDGRMPRPKMKVANVNLTFVAFVNSYQDGVGASVKRLRTFKKYLDGEAGADSSAQFPMDTFIIEQKTSHNNIYIEWELISPMDIGSKMIPKNQAISYCQHRYRYWNGTSMDYSNSTCPYTGTGYFKENGASTTSSLDVCGKKYSDCRLRYPLSTDIIPMKGFPGIGTVPARYR